VQLAVQLHALLSIHQWEGDPPPPHPLQLGNSTLLLTTISPRVGGRTTVKRKDAGQKLVSAGFPICILLTCSRKLCGYQGWDPGEGKRDFGEGISDPGERIRDPGGGIRGPGEGIRDPGEGISDPGEGMRDPGGGIRGPGGGIRDPGGGIRDPGEGVKLGRDLSQGRKMRN
jgi:hypothetical protein